jgi:hypothetical protein
MKKEVKELGQWFDDKIDFANLAKGLIGVGVESVDGFVFTQLLNFLYQKTPEDKKDEILALFVAIKNEDIEEVNTILSTELVTRIDTDLGDSIESIILKGVLDIFIKLVINK